MNRTLYVKLSDLISQTENIEDLKKIGLLLNKLPDDKDKEGLLNTLAQQAAYML